MIKKSILQNNCFAIFKNKYVMKYSKKRPTTDRRPQRPNRSLQWVTLDWILEQKRAINGKTDETQIRLVILLQYDTSVTPGFDNCSTVMQVVNRGNWMLPENYLYCLYNSSYISNTEKKIIFKFLKNYTDIMIKNRPALSGVGEKTDDTGVQRNVSGWWKYFHVMPALLVTWQYSADKTHWIMHWWNSATWKLYLNRDDKEEFEMFF